MLNDLYQEMILDHNNNPRNQGTLLDYTHKGEGHNPLCGDKLTVYVKIEDDVITDITYKACGCAISIASASIMSETVKHMQIDKALTLKENVHKMLTQAVEIPNLGKVEILQGVKKFPARVKCASLSWHTLAAIFNQTIAKTE